MADKNSIVHRVSLEGDADVKARLKSVEEAMKRLEQTNASGGKGIDGSLKGLADAGGKVRESLAPILGEIGAGGGLFASLGGVFSKLAAGLTSPGGIIASLSATAIQMARIGDETRRTEARITALGGGSNVFAKLTESAKTLGVSRDVLEPGLEEFLANFSRNRRPLQMIGGRGPAGLVDFKPDVDEFLAAQRSLFYGARAGGQSNDQAKAAIEAFRSIVSAQGGLTNDAVASLQMSSPSLAKRLAQTLSPLASGIGGFRDAGDLGRYLDEYGAIPEKRLNQLLAGDEPSARRDSDAARGVGDAFDALRAQTSRLTEAFGAADGGIAIRFIDGLTQWVGKVADHVGQAAEGKEPKSLSEVWNGKEGDVLDRADAYLYGKARDAFKFLRDGPEALQQTPGDVLEKLTSAGAAAAADIDRVPAHLYGMGRELRYGPEALQTSDDEFQKLMQAIGLAGTPTPAPPPPAAPATPGDVWVADPNAPGGMRRTTIPTAAGSEMPGPPPAPEIVPPQPLEQRSDASDAATQSLAALDGTAAKTSASLDKFATDLAVILDRLAGGTSSSTPAKAAGGGLITGPGTSTSDSIPAMLSNREYVMPAEATRAIGTGILDTLRLPAQRAGLLSRMRRAARRFADGGVVSWRDENFWKKHKKEVYLDDPEMEEQRNIYLFNHPLGDFEKKTFADLGPGDHQITFDPNSGGAIIDGINYGPNDPLLNDPIIRQELDASAAAMGQDTSKSKFKSWFVGKFGEHADGGPISGPGTGTSDSIPAMLSDGEHVIKTKQATKYRPLLTAINDGNESKIERWMRERYGTTMVSLPGFAVGGMVGDVGSLGGSTVPDLPEFGAASSTEALHPVTIAMPDGREIGGLRAPRDVVRALEREARTESLTTIGRSPSWNRGQGY